jgi:hypothetical protein
MDAVPAPREIPRIPAIMPTAESPGMCPVTQSVTAAATTTTSTTM